MTGIICAMNLEVEGILNLMTNTEEKTVDGVTFYKGFLGESEIVAVECGIGKVNSAICTRMMIDFYRPDCIINIATSAVQHDYDSTAFGDPKGLITCPDGNIINFPADEEVSAKLFDAANSLEGTRVFRGVIATGDKFVADSEERLAIGREFSALACEMEGGAMAQVCYRARVPFAILRSISDDIGHNTTVDFNEFKIMAADKTIKVLSAVLK